MHVVKIRDDQGAERIYAGKVLKRADDTLTLLCNGEELNIAVKYVLEIVPVFAKPSATLH